ncbi:UNKNOWN [Stylonychia lemnae]|uniref:Uncharacterized protein n=1 Tax=Stylonychia lemnae TaxID=5949 RepID=A0A078B8N4_STYLE|nr:UNKNOWN [Stylonychia lemnae]|eukprot:CDW89883.1 UNKNOWN [Stylonychia lemnae]
MNQNNNNQNQNKQNQSQDPQFKEGIFSKVTKPVGRPKPNLNKIPYNQWDWKISDPDFYESFHRLPDSKIPEIYNQVKWNRYNQSLYAAEPPKRLDFRPQTVWKKMKLEVVLLGTGIILGFMLPTFIRWGKKRELEREQDDQRRQYQQMNMQGNPQRMGSVRINQNLGGYYSENYKPGDNGEDQASLEFANRVALLSQEERDKRELVENATNQPVHGLGSGYFKT